MCKISLCKISLCKISVCKISGCKIFLCKKISNSSPQYTYTKSLLSSCRSTATLLPANPPFLLNSLKVNIDFFIVGTYITSNITLLLRISSSRTHFSFLNSLKVMLSRQSHHHHQEQVFTMGIAIIINNHYNSHGQELLVIIMITTSDF